MRPALAAVLLLSWLGANAPAPLPPAPAEWVTDEPSLLSAATRDRLNLRLAEHQRATGQQVLVWVGRTSGGLPLEDFAARAFQAWRVGRAGLDDGLVLFVLVDERSARIEVGYGLEATLPDAVASRIMRERLLPGLAAGDADRAVEATVDALLERLAGAAGPAAGPQGWPELSVPRLVVTGLLAVGLVVLFLINPRLALSALFIISGLGRGRRSGGGFHFSGGGGRSGGGGASGRW